MMNRFFYLLTVTAALVFINGCVWVSLHKYYPTKIEARYKDTRQPASIVPVAVQYWYDSYGIFYDLRKPKKVSSKTDANGEVILDIADYSGGINLYIGDTGFSIDKNIVQNGGQPRGYQKKSKSQNYREIELKISPTSR